MSQIFKRLYLVCKPSGLLTRIWQWRETNMIYKTLRECQKVSRSFLNVEENYLGFGVNLMSLRGIAAVEIHLRWVCDGGEMSHCCVYPPCLPESVALKRTLTLQRADGNWVTDISWRSRAASSKAHPWWWYLAPVSPFLAQMRIVTSFLFMFSLQAKVPRFPFFHCNDSSPLWED